MKYITIPLLFFQSCITIKTDCKCQWLNKQNSAIPLNGGTILTPTFKCGGDTSMSKWQTPCKK